MTHIYPTVPHSSPPVERGWWSRNVARAEVSRHPCLVYQQRPPSVPALLLVARRWHSRTHFVQGHRRITFETHERAVMRVAQRLQQAGIRAQDRVLLFGVNQVEWVVAFWAIQCLGAVAVLGNAWWSEKELREVMESIRPKLALSDLPRPGGLSDDIPHLSFANLRTLVDDNGECPEFELAPINENDPSLIIFSSGTTGAARGVLLSHRSVVANLQNLLVLTGRLPSELPDTHPGTVSLLSVPLFHLAGLQVTISTLLSGGSLIFLEGRFDAAEALRLIEKERVRVWGSVPTMVSRVIDHEDFTRYDTAGAGSEMEQRPGCVGRPLPVVEVRIKNPDVDGVGEILARTPTAMSGYWGEPSATVDVEGWVATGDLGRLDAEGYLYVVGRSKDVIIRGGENIASVHVEQALLTHPDVIEAAVVALPHPDLGEEVGAALLLRPGADPDIAGLRFHAAQSLARFAVPTRWWIRRASLPTNATGKILRREITNEWMGRGGNNIIE